MVMEYGENDDAPDGVTKWPFYLSALFIISLVLGFAYLHLEENNTLDQWQITTCVLASALASILVFIPHLLDRFLYLVFDPANRKDEELHRKTYFDIKEMRGDLESLAVKIDKVPSVVDKILSESLAKGEDANSSIDKLAADLEETKDELIEKLEQLQELSEQSPLLPEPDPAIAKANESIGKLETSLTGLSAQLEKLQETVDRLPTESVPEPESSESERGRKPEDQSIEEIPEEKKVETEVSEDEVEAEVRNPIPKPILEKEEREPETADDSEEEDQRAEKFNETEEEEESLADEEEDDPLTAEPLKAEEADEDQDEGQTGELKLELPDPEETLRKVDALLAGEDESDDPEPDKKEKPKSSKSGSTSVVANVMIGIGNKPYLRGEGAGLSWDEGVPMNFIEIGKWAWTPTRKNAALTVQVYRNDEDPDKGGKMEVKSGEEIEITPDFG